MMRPHDSAVDHLDTVGLSPAVGQGFQYGFPDPGLRPARELAVDRAPLAEIVMQVTPLRPGSRDPENPIQYAPVVTRRTPALAAARHHKGLEERPFRVRHQTANHNPFRKSDLESRFEPYVNPLCQHNLGRIFPSLCGAQAPGPERPRQSA
jgi:hypothetical protein